jgi:hypothetical protein
MAAADLPRRDLVVVLVERRCPPLRSPDWRGQHNRQARRRRRHAGGVSGRRRSVSYRPRHPWRGHSPRGRRSRTGGRGGRTSGFQPAMVRAQSRACALSVMPGKCRRNSTAAANSPPCSKAARIAAASSSEMTNMRGSMGKRATTGKSGGSLPVCDASCRVARQHLRILRTNVVHRARIIVAAYRD